MSDIPRRRRRAAGSPVDAADAQAILDTETPEAPEPASAPPASAGNPNAPRELFATAPGRAGFPRPPDLQRGFQVIVSDLFKSGYDVAKEWAEVRDGLEIKDALTPERLKRAANGQERLAERAHQLYIVAKVEVSAYMRETESTYGAIRDAATQELEKQKANKSRTKMITEADVLTTAAQLYPDEWSDICTRRERAEAMLAQLQNLAGLARSRCYTVSNMMSPNSRSA